MSRKRTIDSFFKRKVTDNEEAHPLLNAQTSNLDTNVESGIEVEEPVVLTFEQLVQPPPSQALSIEQERVNIDTLVRDPGKRPQIWNYPANQQDEIRRAYIKFGPYQYLMDVYPLSGQGDHPRRFQSHWFRTFPWLEYSKEVDASFCFPCYLFSKKSSPFISKGFRNWRKVNSGKDCVFLTHMGKNPNSPHNVALRCCEDFKNHFCHIDNVLSKQTSQQILDNRLRLKASVDVVRWLTFQACAFGGHDESVGSRNRGNFLEMIKLLASCSKEVDDVVLENAPQNASYTSPTIQKEILEVFARKVQNVIREEIGDAKFCLLVDEAREESKREQMALVMRFVDKNGYVNERFLDMIHVTDTTSCTLKQGIYSILSHHNLNILNVRGQGYDGASNMRGEWNGLKALILQECPYAYYVHCLTHQLQLALVASSKEAVDVHAFFQNLIMIVNVVSSSCKRNDELRAAYANETAHLIANEEIETGRGANLIDTLQRPGDTRWSSHFKSICSLLRLYGATVSVLEDLAIKGSTYSQRGDATYALKSLISFEFVFIMHLMKEFMGITDKHCQALQQKCQDILNAMCVVSSTKSLIQNFRDFGWNAFIETVTSFCNSQAIEIPDMSSSFSDIIRSRRRKDSVTVEHHYRIDVFNAVIDYQLKELNSRFSEQATELLTLSTSLDPKDTFRLFNAGHICSLVDKFYHLDFPEQERIQLEYELKHYEFDVPKDVNFHNWSTIGELCQKLVETGKSTIFPLLDRLLRLVLTLPVSTATTERAFSAMKVIKTRLRNKMEDDFLTDYMIVYIEKEIAEIFSTNVIIDDFYCMKRRRLKLQVPNIEVSSSFGI